MAPVTQNFHLSESDPTAAEKRIWGVYRGQTCSDLCHKYHALKTLNIYTMHQHLIGLYLVVSCTLYQQSHDWMKRNV